MSQLSEWETISCLFFLYTIEVMLEKRVQSNWTKLQASCASKRIGHPRRASDLGYLNPLADMIQSLRERWKCECEDTVPAKRLTAPPDVWAE